MPPRNPSLRHVKAYPVSILAMLCNQLPLVQPLPPDAEACRFQKSGPVVSRSRSLENTAQATTAPTNRLCRRAWFLKSRHRKMAGYLQAIAVRCEHANSHTLKPTCSERRAVSSRVSLAQTRHHRRPSMSGLRDIRKSTGEASRSAAPFRYSARLHNRPPWLGT